MRIPITAIFRRRLPAQDLPARSSGVTWRFHLGVLLALIVSVSATAFYGLATSNWHEFVRRVALLELRRSLGRDISLGGVQIDLKGRVVLTDVIVYEPVRDARPLLAAPRVEVRFEPTRLYASPTQPVGAIRQVVLDRPVMAVSRDARGRWSFADLFKERKPTTENSFHGELLVHDGELFYREAKGWRPGQGGFDEHLTKLSIRALMADDHYMPFHLTAVSQSGHARVIEVAGSTRFNEGRIEAEVGFGTLDLNFARQFLPTKIPVSIASGHADGRLHLMLSQNPRTHEWQSAMTVLADVRDLRGQLRLSDVNHPYQVTQGQIRFASGVLEMVDLHANLDGVPALVNGTISNFDHPVLALQVQVAGTSAVNLCRVIPALSRTGFTWSGPASGWAQIIGRTDQLQAFGHLSGPTLVRNVGKARLELHQIAGDLRYNGSSLEISSLSARSFGGLLTGHAWLALADSARKGEKTLFMLQGHAAGMDVAQIAGFVTASQSDSASTPVTDLAGTVSGPVTLSMTAGETEQDTHLSLMTQARGQVRLAEHLEATLDTILRIDSGGTSPLRAEFKRIDLQTAAGAVHLNGTLVDDALALDVQASPLDLHALTAFMPKTSEQLAGLAGTGYLTGKIAAKIHGGQLVDLDTEQPIFSGNVRAQDGKFSGREFDDFSTSVRVSYRSDAQPPQLTLDNVRLNADGHLVELTQVTAALSGEGWAKGEWALANARISRSKLSSLIALAGPNSPLAALQLDGFVEGDITSATFPTEAQGTGTLIISRPSIQLDGSTLEFKRATLHFALRDPHTFELTDGKLEYDSTSPDGPAITMHGWVSNATHLHPDVNMPTGWLAPDRTLPPEKRVSLFVEGKALATSRLVQFSNSMDANCTPSSDGRICLPLNLDGAVTLTATITGQLADPEPTGVDNLSTVIRKSADIFAKSMQVHGAVTAEDDFTIGRKSFREFAAEVNFRPADHRVEITRFVLAPGDGTRDYQLVFAPKPGTNAMPGSVTFAAQPQYDFNLRLQGASPDRPANLADFRQDLLDIANATAIEASYETSGDVSGAEVPETTRAKVAPQAGTTIASVFTALAGYLNSLPEPFAGEGMCVVEISDTAIDLELDVAALRLSGQAMPTISTALHLDKDQRTLEINRFVAQGGLDPNAEIRVTQRRGQRNFITFPVRDASGEQQPEPFELHVEAQNIDPSALARFFPQSQLKRLGGEMTNITLDTLDGATTAQPKLQASIEWANPVIAGMPFDLAHAILTLENDETHPNQQRLWIGLKNLGEVGATTVQLVDPRRLGMPPLEISGYLPLRWKSRLQPEIPLDQPFELTINLPEHRLAALHTYLPFITDAGGDGKLQGDGTVAGRVQLGGTIAYPEFRDRGYLTIKSPELILSHSDGDAPNRLRDVVADINFFAQREKDRLVNVIAVNDVSALYDRNDYHPPKPTLWQRFMNVLGFEKKYEPPLSNIVAQGSIKILTPLDGWASLDALLQPTSLAQHVRYDLYAEMSKAPIKRSKIYDGTVSAYLHLGNRQDQPAVPLLNGLVFAENSTITYAGGASSPFEMPSLPFDPELSLFVQVGEKNAFVVAPDNSLVRNAIYGIFPFVSTGPQLFSPDDIATSGAQRRGDKALLDPRSPVFHISAESMQLGKNGDEYTNGTFGTVTGKLSDPVVNATYVLVPRKSQFQLPGGLLSVQLAHGTFKFDSRLPNRTSLTAFGEASGTVDQQTIKASIDGELINPATEGTLVPGSEQVISGLPLHLESTSSPPGVRRLTETEISYRLIGAYNLMDVIQGKESMFSESIWKYYLPNIFVNSRLRALANRVNLESLSMGFDPTGNPEASLTTQEFGITPYSAFHLGASRTFSLKPDWRLWLDYRIPSEEAWLRNFSFTMETNSKQEPNLNLQYKIDFTTAGKQ